MLGLLLFLAGMALMPAPGLARDKADLPGDVPPPPPEPNPLAVEVPRGGPVWITLSAYSISSPVTGYRIKRGAKAGKLGAPQLVTADTGRVKYTPPRGAGPGEDSFSYEVQSRDGISAPAEVHITITDTDPVVITPGDIEFGQLLPGQTARRPLVMQNIGGGLAQGTLRVPDGWTIDGTTDYRLEAGEKQTFTLIFKPAQARAYSGDIEYTGNPERATDLNGELLEPLAVTSGTVELRAAGGMRIGTIHVENRTEGSQTVQVTPGPRLDADATATLPPKDGADILVRAKEGGGEINDTVTVEGDGLKLEVPVHAAAEEMKESVAAHAVASTPAPALAANRPSAARAGNAIPAPPAPDAQPGLPPLAPLPDESAAEPGDARAGTPLRAINIEAVGENTAVAACDFKGATGIRTYRMEAQSVALDPDRMPVPVWSVFGRAMLEVDGTVVKARMQSLQPGTLYVVRLVGLDEKGNIIERSGPGQVWTLAAKKGRGWWWAAGGAAVAAAGAWAWWKRGSGWA